ncbi:MAG: class I SAM-dependent methyltransferase, partial [Nanoarchaeota archaeon]|nr:class I SAM-dependent methyltransferase [Nanoarchaeota archaeon]
KKCKKITGVDISSEAIRLAKIEASHHNNLSVDFISNDITKIKLPDNTFDKIFSFCVIEHISNYNEILKELHRILKKDGTLIMSVDSLSGIDPELKRKHKKEHSVHNYFTLNTFNNTMLNSGFSSIEKRYIFCGKYAKRLFEKGIQNKFRFNILATLYYYVNLSIRERFSNKKEGMFIAGVYKKT